MKLTLIRLILLYLKRHKKILLLFCIFPVIFAVIFSLYNLPVEAVLYSVLLCGVFLLIFAGYDLWRYYSRHKLLHELLDCITLTTDDLPEPKDLWEQDYQILIRAIHQDKIQIISEADFSRSNMIEYYTLWAHQIKTPIFAMHLLLQSDESDQNSDLLAELFKIEQYVEMVLGYLRLESTSTDYIIKTYSLDTILKQAIRKYAKQFIRKKISLDFNESGQEVLTDEKWLLFVIEQLLSNALKYTNEGRISIYLMLTEAKTLVIEDTGIGIQAEDLPRVFEKGFTGYNGRADKKSTGIGLFLCKRILSKLSHTIRIESEVDKGTKVLIGLNTIELEVE